MIGPILLFRANQRRGEGGGLAGTLHQISLLLIVYPCKILTGLVTRPFLMTDQHPQSQSDISGEMYFIFGSIIGGLPSNCTKGDMKNCLSRCNEPDHIFKSSEPWLHSSLCSVSHQ